MKQSGTDQIGRYLVSCTECGVVIERWYSDFPEDDTKAEDCPTCHDKTHFRHVNQIE